MSRVLSWVLHLGMYLRGMGCLDLALPTPHRARFTGLLELQLRWRAAAHTYTSDVT